jgi:hypothetical protein
LTGGVVLVLVRHEAKGVRGDATPTRWRRWSKGLSGSRHRLVWCVIRSGNCTNRYAHYNLLNERGRETSRQLRDIKKTQYSATHRAIELEVQSISTVLVGLIVGNTNGAIMEIRSFRAGRDEVIAQLASLPLIADSDVVKASRELVKTRDQCVTELVDLAKIVDSGGQPNAEQIGSLGQKLKNMRKAQGVLLAAMRFDLYIP